MHQVFYSSTRGEIWQWYWRAWARPLGFWRFHILVALIVATVWTLRFSPLDPTRFIKSFLVAVALCLVVLPLWPQFKFKPQRRLLIVDAKGWTTQIGDLKASLPWSAVRSVENTPESIVLVSSTGNSLIVPNRAFTRQEDRAQFLADVSEWHARFTA